MRTRTRRCWLLLFSWFLLLPTTQPVLADVLKNDATGETIKGTLLDQKINGQTVFKLENGGTKFIHPEEWTVIETGPVAPKPADTVAKPPAPAPAGTAASSQTGTTPPVAPPGPKAPTAMKGTKASVTAALAKKISVDFKDTSLDNVLKSVRELSSGLNIVISPDIAVAGIDLSKITITLKARDISAKSVLKLAMFDSQCVWREEVGYLLITTRAQENMNLPVVRYQVGDPSNQLQGLIDAIKCAANNRTDPDVAAWTDDGGSAVIQFLDRQLIVSQTPRGQEVIQDLFNQLRTVVAGRANPAIAAMTDAKPDPRLQKKIAYDFEKMPLRDLLEAIDRKLGGVNLVADPTATGAEAEVFNQPVDLPGIVKQPMGKGVTAGEALWRIFESGFQSGPRPGLVYKVQPDYILVTTAKRLPQELVTLVYPFPVRAGLPLVGGRPAGMSIEQETKEDIALILQTVNNTSDPGISRWSDEGGSASIKAFQKALIITQSPHGQYRVIEFFKGLASMGTGAK